MFEGCLGVRSVEFSDRSAVGSEREGGTDQPSLLAAVDGWAYTEA